jgi:transposase-like protein
VDEFCDRLLQVAIANGTIAKVAAALDVEPAHLYRWVGGLRPSERQRSQIVLRLKELEILKEYFQRHGAPLGA